MDSRPRFPAKTTRWQHAMPKNLFENSFGGTAHFSGSIFPAISTMLRSSDRLARFTQLLKIGRSFCAFMPWLWNGKADTILREETLRHLHEPDEESMYAGGWIIFEREWAKGPVLFHNGSNTVWFCNVFLVPEQKRGIFAMTNAADTKSQRAIDQALQWMIKRHPRVD